jgi:hypothetical protein
LNTAVCCAGVSEFSTWDTVGAIVLIVTARKQKVGAACAA